MYAQKTILVVEDNEISRKTLCNILAQTYHTIEAENGQVAHEILCRNKSGIALILLDLVMPVMDGFALLDLIRKDVELAAIPVIVATQQENAEVLAFQHGATDVVRKPYNAQIIMHRVEAILNLWESAAALNQMKHDSLTGLYGKEYFYQCAKQAILQSPDRDYDILCSDIENFKLVNDVFGIDKGNELLRFAAQTMQDILGRETIIGRIGADQFAALIDRETPFLEDNFNEATERINTMRGINNISIKWGIYTVDDPTLSVEAMCDRACLAIRAVKGRYGQAFSYYDDTLRNNLLTEQSIIAAMETALTEEQFQIYLQPKYSLRSGQITGAEALVRWIHPQRGFLSPADFIPVFERNGFIVKLDQYVWDKTCALMRSWSDRGLPMVPVSVNVSRADIYQPDLVGVLQRIVAKYDLAAELLHLEITESAYTDNTAQLIETVVSLRNCGFIIEMDDFGSGYSSLNMLNELPIDVLKLDLKFLQNHTQHPHKRSILGFIVSLAKWMNLRVTAEGVETAEQLEKLTDLDCDCAQGYYFAKPMPSQEFEELLVKVTPEAPEEEVADLDASLTFTGRAILVADETETYCSFVRERFGGQYEIIETETATCAARVLEERSDMIAAIVLSLTLPDPDGFFVLRKVKNSPMWKDIPVIVISPANEVREMCALELGADDFLVRHHHPRILKKHLWNALSAAIADKQAVMLRRAAYQDFLTGLLNRRGFDRATEAITCRDASHAIYLFDLDNMKYCNDTFGHSSGDQMLRQFAAVLRAETRAGDILARIGGDEFCVVLKNIPSEAVALKKGLRICRAARAYSGDESQCNVSCSAGVAMLYPGDVPSEVVQRADHALYRAKRKGKSCCCLWEGAE